MILRKRRHRKRAKERDQKWSKICTQKQKKRKKKEKKSRPFPFAFVCTRNTLQREREKARVYERKKKMSENIINKDNNKQMTTRERQHIEVAKLEAELNALKVDAFAKVRRRCCFFFFFLRWLCVLNHRDDEISSRSIRALSSRFSAATTDRQKPKQRVYFCARC